jgi:hypothetical protein
MVPFLVGPVASHGIQIGLLHIVDVRQIKEAARKIGDKA